MQNETQRDLATPSRQTSVEKAIDILFCFDASHVQLRLTDISDQLGLNRSTTHRLLAVLKKKGLVVSDPKTQLYSLGPGVADLAWVVLGQHDLRSVCHPYLVRLQQMTHETASLFTRVGDKSMCVEELESEQHLKFAQRVGMTVPLHVGAAGKVLLAFLPPEELETLLGELDLSAITENTITDREQLSLELVVTRTRGFAISAGERTPGGCAVAAPVWDRSGRPIAAACVFGPDQRLTLGKLQELGPQVIQVAQEMSAALGYVPQSTSDGVKPARRQSR
jgi:DNA-binding IclR family transcriptional regulator